jgi:arylsulfatase A-like enzyme
MKASEGITRRQWLAAAAGALAAGRPSEGSPNRPNIILILADDMGFSDVGCYGSEIATPNLDALASRGVRFTQFYSSARCCPTRASLLTGLYPHQAGVGYMEPHNRYNRPAIENLRLPQYQGFLNDRCVTIAEALRPTGYQTFMSGKWHVGALPGQRPLDRGFDRFFRHPRRSQQLLEAGSEEHLRQQGARAFAAGRLLRHRLLRPIRR